MFEFFDLSKLEFNLTVPRIAICFVISLATTIGVRFLLGPYRDIWFKRTTPTSMITFRTPLSTHVALGYPICKEGYMVTAVLLLILAVEIILVLTY